jgi:outer membrane protein TolC
LSLQSQLRSTELQGRAVRYERLPTVAVGGFYGVIGETQGLYHGNFIAQAGLDFPIFQEAQIRGDKQTIEAQRMHLRQQIESLHDDIEEQIRSSKLDVDTYTQLVSVARSNVDLSLQILNDSQDRYRAGVDDDLPVVRAQATLAAAQSQLVESMFQFNQAKLQLARSVGVVETQFHNYLGQ